MSRVFRSKFMPPAAAGCLARPRLSEPSLPVQFLVIQAPAGAGKSTFLAQWLAAVTDRKTLFYRLDDEDRDGAVFAAHLASGLQDRWPAWQPSGTAATDPRELAVQLVNEAAGRPPTTLALDGLEAAFGQPFLADFLTVLFRYAPPSLHVALATRAPLPIDLAHVRAPLRQVGAADLALTPAEAAAWLGPGNWQPCLAATGCLPLALHLWRQSPGGPWQDALITRLVADRPPHIPAEMARSLTEEWLAGHMTLEAYGHQISCGQPGAEQMWTDVAECRQLYADHPPAARERLAVLWETARGRGDRPLMGAVALLSGEIAMALGDYGQAMEWYRQSFEADPALELSGAHAMVIILRDQGHLAEAERLARRCLDARRGPGDLLSLGLAHLWYGCICMELGRLDEAEAEFRAADRQGGQLYGDTVVSVLATTHLALVAATRGDATGFRRLAEDAYGRARGRWRWFEALTGHVLASALVAWGETERARALLAHSFDYLSAIGAKWHLHVMLTVLARQEWQAGRHTEARARFDQVLAQASREGYLQYLQAPRSGALPLIVDALTRGVETAFCGDLLARMGDRALPALLDLAQQPEPAARRAAVYPLSAIGGDEAGAALRSLLHDPDDTVRDRALLALQNAAPPPAMARPPARRVSAAVLGPLVVAVDGAPVPRWRTVKARDLLAYLLLAQGRPVTRDQVLEALWPEADPQSALPLLHTSVYYLRRTVEQGAGEFITYAGGAYRLQSDQVELDLERFVALAGPGDEAAWQAAVLLYRGDVLEGLDYPWCEGVRTRMRNLYLETLRKLADRCRTDGRTGQAIHFLQMRVQTDPLAEEGHLALMECFAQQGNRGAALEQYRTLARLLDEELGVEPDLRARELYRRLLD